MELETLGSWLQNLKMKNCLYFLTVCMYAFFFMYNIVSLFWLHSDGSSAMGSTWEMEGDKWDSDFHYLDRDYLAWYLWRENFILFSCELVCGLTRSAEDWFLLLSISLYPFLSLMWKAWQLKVVWSWFTDLEFHVWVWVWVCLFRGPKPFTPIKTHVS